MHGLGKKSSVQESGKSLYSTPLSKLLSSTKFKKGGKVSHVKKVKPKSKTTIASSLLKKIKADSSRKGIQNNGTYKKSTSKKGLHKARDADNSNKSSSLKLQKEKVIINWFNEKGETDGETRTRKRRRKKSSKKNKVDVDETGRLQRRTRYLIIKIKLEQNLIDAYAGEGWKGQSREKIRPERELQRAQNQILKCKLGIRDAIHHLHSLGSVGSIEDSFIDADGSVFHEHIFCAKCKLNETLPDNDIVLCDGTCNAAFHQKCLDPPLDTENIPRGDQGWFCKFCECKMEILEVVNAHLGTTFSMDSTWQDVFKEEAAMPEGGNLLLNQDEDWPSDESDDDDYNPNRKVISCSSVSRDGSKDNASDDELSTDGSVGSDEYTDGDIVSGRRQRSTVDYKKLYDEMFGKDSLVVEQVSDDEDWGPGKRKRREKESDAASTLMALCDSKRDPGSVSGELKRKPTTGTQARRSCFRIPQNAVEKLRQVFAENELPSKAAKDNLSKELGLDPEKVSKWFKNTRYLALKTRKAEGTKDHYTSASEINKESRCGNVIGKADDLMESDSEDIIDETVVHSPRNIKKCFRRKHPKSLNSPLKKNQQGFSRLSPAKNNKDGIELSDDISLRKLLKGKTKEKRAKKFAENSAESQVAELEMERLCKVKSRLDNMRRILLKFQKSKVKKSRKPSLHEQEVVYVPIAELREKM